MWAQRITFILICLQRIICMTRSFVKRGGLVSPLRRRHWSYMGLWRDGFIFTISNPRLMPWFTVFLPPSIFHQRRLIMLNIFKWTIMSPDQGWPGLWFVMPFFLRLNDDLCMLIMANSIITSALPPLIVYPELVRSGDTIIIIGSLPGLSADIQYWPALGFVWWSRSCLIFDNINKYRYGWNISSYLNCIRQISFGFGFQ